jgi:hypothetical protein
LVLIRGIEWQDEGWGRVSRLQEGAKKKQDKGGAHKEMIRGNGWVESEDESVGLAT